jgi:hypothetical protein
VLKERYLFVVGDLALFVSDELIHQSHEPTSEFSGITTKAHHNAQSEGRLEGIRSFREELFPATGWIEAPYPLVGYLEMAIFAKGVAKACLEVL